MISEIVTFLATPIFSYTPVRWAGGFALFMIGLVAAKSAPHWLDNTLPTATLQDHKWRAIKIGAGITVSYFLLGAPFLTHPLVALIYASAMISLGIRQANVILEKKESLNPLQ